MKTSGLAAVAVVATSVLPPAVAFAEWPDDANVKLGRFSFNLGGEYRLAGGRVSAIDIELADPAREDVIPAEPYLAHRLRFAPSLTLAPASGVVRKIAAIVEVDFMDGTIIAGEGRGTLANSRDARRSRDAVDADNISVNKAFLHMAIPPVIVKAGRQKSQLGLGIMANGGDEGETRFGATGRGDVVDRGMVTLLAGKLLSSGLGPDFMSLSVAGDRVVRDVFADSSIGDRAYQAITALHWHWGFGKAGAHYIYRWQDNDLGDRTRAHVADLFVDLGLKAGDLTLGVAGEFAGVFGTTEAPRGLGRPDGVDVRAFGWMGAASLKHRWFSVVFEVGQASGDDDAMDGTHRSFVMNPEHRVGLVMFPEVQKVVSGITAWNLADPRFSGRPPRGFRAVATNGGVSNAVYAFPRLAFTGVPHVEVLVGFVGARSDVPWVDPFQSAIAGGGKVGPRGGKAARDIGFEVDAAVKTRWKLGPAGLSGAVEYGYFRAGAALADATGARPDPVHLVQGRVQIEW